MSYKKQASKGASNSTLDYHENPNSLAEGSVDDLYEAVDVKGGDIGDENCDTYEAMADDNHASDAGTCVNSHGGKGGNNGDDAYLMPAISSKQAEAVDHSSDDHDTYLMPTIPGKKVAKNAALAKSAAAAYGDLNAGAQLYVPPTNDGPYDTYESGAGVTTYEADANDSNETTQCHLAASNSGTDDLGDYEELEVGRPQNPSAAFKPSSVGATRKFSLRGFDGEDDYEPVARAGGLADGEAGYEPVEQGASYVGGVAPKPLSRKEAEAVLCRGRQWVGKFLIRPGGAKHGEGHYVLSRVTAARIKHDVITPITAGGRTAYEVMMERYSSLGDIVEHFQREGRSPPSAGTSSNQENRAGAGKKARKGIARNNRKGSQSLVGFDERATAGTEA